MRNSSDEKKFRKIFAHLCNAILAVALKLFVLSSMVRGGNASYHIEVKVFFYIHQHDMMQCLLFGFGTLQFRTFRGQESTLLAEIGITQFRLFYRSR
jgi:hypothetical protein